MSFRLTDASLMGIELFSMCERNGLTTLDKTLLAFNIWLHDETSISC